VAGDLWMLDDHKFLCGDATTVGAIQTVLAGGYGLHGLAVLGLVHGQDGTEAHDSE